MSGARLTYAVVSPVRDEERFLPLTAASLAAQTRPPARWVIVDDGSADGSAEIADRLAAEHDWISVVHRPRRTARERGGPIVQAFNAGRAMLDERPDVLVKLDGDLHLPSHYFEWVMAVFERMPSAGIVGGTVYVPKDGRWIADPVARHTVHGVAKAYRSDCLEAIGGLQPAMGWDGIDEYAARARGWEVVPLSELMILHYKPRGSKQRWWRSRWEEGRGAHYMGYGTPGILLRVGYRAIKETPPIIGGLTLGTAYALSRLRRAPQVPDASASELLRAEQRRRFLGLLRLNGSVDPTPAPSGGPSFWALDDAAPVAHEGADGNG